VLPGDDGDLLLPSCVGFSETGKLLVGREALRQYAAAPERTVKSIKRWMGTDHKTTLKMGDETREFLPQEISAMILRSLKQRAEAALGEPVTQAVVTVPAYFTDAQRQATKLAGELAGLEVLQIINEPTAAALTYDVRTEATERVLVYDLGGGTFDVSVVEVTGDVTEVLASHGNNQLGGDDFDRRLQLYLADQFRKAHGVDVPQDAATQARLLRAAEQAKMNLSAHGFTTVREAYLSQKGSAALHLETEVSRAEFEKLIQPLLAETLESIDRALSDAKLTTEDIERVILVGGSTRIPLVRKMLEAHLGQAPTDSVQPDLCVALGAAIQAGVLTGADVDAILVDVIPHSLGISVLMGTPMGMIPGFFSVIIPRNSVVPVSRSQVYSTASDDQTTVQIEVFQGENPIAEENVPLGDFVVEGLPPRPAGGVAVEVHFDFDLNGILTVTATEKGQGQQGSLVVSNSAIEQLSSHELAQAQDAIASLFESDETIEVMPVDSELSELLERASTMMETLDDEQSEELEELLDQLETAMAEDSDDTIAQVREEIEDFLYYVSSNS
jgi:molecular chaperone DnaK